MTQILYSEDNTTADVTNNCPWCNKPATVTGVPVEGLVRWRAGEHIQNAFPGMSAADREILLTGTHDECWCSTFGEDDDA